MRAPHHLRRAINYERWSAHFVRLLSTTILLSKPYFVSVSHKMVHQEVYHLHPYGWESSPQEERYKISTLDYLTGLCYTHFAIYFRLDDGSKPKAAAVLKEGLERTLGQVGHLCSTIEKDSGGGSFLCEEEGEHGAVCDTVAGRCERCGSIPLVGRHGKFQLCWDYAG